MTNPTTNNSIIIFHRSKHNSEEDLINQQTFLETNREIIGSAKIIDYMSGQYPEAREALEVFKDIKPSTTKVTVILNSFLSKKDYELEYNLYQYFRSFTRMSFASIYLMDSEGRLYKETKTIE